MKKEVSTFSKFWVKLDDNKWSKWKKNSKRKNFGLKKGDGGLPEGGPVGASTAMSAETLTIGGSSLLKEFRFIIEDDVDNIEIPPVDVENQDNAIDNEQQPQDDMEQPADDQMADGEQENTDPDREGVIRSIPNAHLVYKRKTVEDRYEELWIFKNDDHFKGEIDIKNDILAATDIQPSNTQSEDGLQSYDLWTAGNIHFLHITGLPE